MSTDCNCCSSLGVKYLELCFSLWNVRPCIVRYSNMLAVIELVLLAL